VAQWLTNPPGSIPALAQWVKDPALLWLWHRLAATSLIRPLAWEPLYAAGSGPRKGKKTKKKKKKKVRTIPFTTQACKVHKEKPYVKCRARMPTLRKCSTNVTEIAFHV